MARPSFSIDSHTTSGSDSKFQHKFLAVFINSLYSIPVLCCQHTTQKFQDYSKFIYFFYCKWISFVFLFFCHHLATVTLLFVACYLLVAASSKAKEAQHSKVKLKFDRMKRIRVTVTVASFRLPANADDFVQ